MPTLVQMLIEFFETCDYLMDYLHYFNLFVQEQQQMILHEKFAPVAMEPSESDMTMAGYKTLKIFHAVENTVASYYQSLHPSEEIRKQFDNLLSEDIEKFLVPILKQTANHDDSATIKNVFFSTANRMIQDDLLPMSSWLEAENMLWQNGYPRNHLNL